MKEERQRAEDQAKIPANELISNPAELADALSTETTWERMSALERASVRAILLGPLDIQMMRASSMKYYNPRDSDKISVPFDNQEFYGIDMDPRRLKIMNTENGNYEGTMHEQLYGERSVEAEMSRIKDMPAHLNKRISERVKELTDEYAWSKARTKRADELQETQFDNNAQKRLLADRNYLNKEEHEDEKDEVENMKTNFNEFMCRIILNPPKTWLDMSIGLRFFTGSVGAQVGMKNFHDNALALEEFFDEKRVVEKSVITEVHLELVMLERFREYSKIMTEMDGIPRVFLPHLIFPETGYFMERDKKNEEREYKRLHDSLTALAEKISKALRESGVQIDNEKELNNVRKDYICED